jgi:hypothetical protein
MPAFTNWILADTIVGTAHSDQVIESDARVAHIGLKPNAKELREHQKSGE